MPRQLVRSATLILALGALFLSSSGGGAAMLVAQVQQDTDGQHVVKPGETLSAISLGRGISQERLLSLNGLTDPNVLSVGQVLKLGDAADRGSSTPAAPPATPARSAPAGGGGEYVVRAGDSVWSIARGFGLPRQALIDANALTEANRLSVGQKLVIPPGATRSGPPPTAAAGEARTETVAGPAGSLADRVATAARAAAGPGGRIGVAGHDLGSGQRLAVSADETFPAASVIKLPILIEAYRQHESGKRPLTDAAKADLRRMIEVSDNSAADRQLDLLGIDNVDAGIRALGLSKTRLVNRFTTAPTDARTLNRTSPSDMVRLLDLLATDQLVSPNASKEMRFLLALNQDGSRLRRGLPREASLSHKSGWFGRVSNDVGIIRQGGSSYVLAVFTEGLRSPEAANQAIGAIAGTVHAAWGRGR